MKTFTVARVITKGNEVTTLFMGLLAFGIALVGLLAFCIGVVAAQPLALMMFACGYLMMSGQLDTRTNPF